MMSESPASVMERTPTLLERKRSKREEHKRISLTVIENVHTTRANTHQDAYMLMKNLPEVLSAGGTELDVGASVVVDTGLGQHSVVLNLRLAKRGAVTGEDNQLG